MGGYARLALIAATPAGLHATTLLPTPPPAAAAPPPSHLALQLAA
eukprot:SAG11_NODE_9734_length_884_cov_2.355414_2_plen_44_part_01